ncbi:MAG: sigma-70 family RNA polymerase sigma factor [Bellilinea sp.]|nr:sigma-70 family RNA polymerase sigma factor [Bellilinea sp.]
MSNFCLWMGEVFQIAGCIFPYTRQRPFDTGWKYNHFKGRNTLMTGTSPNVQNRQAEEAADLLQRAKQFEPQALTAIHDALYPQVFRYVSYRVDDPQTCEDITAEVFLRLLKALKKEDLTIENLRAWLLGTAHHLVQDFYRKSYRHPITRIDQQENLPNGHNPVEEAEQNTTRHQIRRALLQLTEEQQHVLALRFSQELSVHETARVMRKSVEAVKVLQFRALAALRRQLEGNR